MVHSFKSTQVRFANVLGSSFVTHYSSCHLFFFFFFFFFPEQELVQSLYYQQIISRRLSYKFPMLVSASLLSVGPG
jgi:hypothetical protein